MEKTIKRGDIIKASQKALESESLEGLFEGMPILMLLMPMYAMEIEKVIFAEEMEDKE